VSGRLDELYKSKAIKIKSEKVLLSKKFGDVLGSLAGAF
jgi:hypothetical protein